MPELEQPVVGQSWHRKEDGERYTIIATEAPDKICVERQSDGHVRWLRIEAAYRDQSTELAEPKPKPRSPPTPPSQLAGEFCKDCGSPNMMRSGTCLTCRDCGSSNDGCS